MDPAAFVPLGRIVKTHGLAGEVSVAQTGRLPLDLAVGLTVWLVPPPVALRSATVVAVRPGPKGPLVKLSGVDDPDTAAGLRGVTLMARAGDLPPGAGDEEPDPVGLSVRDADRGVLGTVEEVIVTGANDVWIVRGPFGQVLIPVIEQCVELVDWDAMIADVRLLPGLIEDE
ncbi:MAG TPA: ribosome maturation factor RimM [Coriobacteriia bacterium]